MFRRINLWRLRRALLIVCGALIAVAVLMFFNLQISETNHGTTELINGQADTAALALPLAVFVIGAAGLFAVLSWKPRQR